MHKIDNVPLENGRIMIEDREEKDRWRVKARCPCSGSWFWLADESEGHHPRAGSKILSIGSLKRMAWAKQPGSDGRSESLFAAESRMHTGISPMDAPVFERARSG